MAFLRNTGQVHDKKDNPTPSARRRRVFVILGCYTEGVSRRKLRKAWRREKRGASVAQAPSIQLFDAGIEFVIAAAHGEQLFVGAFFDDLALF